MKIGILEPGHSPQALLDRFGDYGMFFETLLGDGGFEFAHYDVEAGVFPQSPADADGWLITGSRHGVYEDHPWLGQLMEFIREVHAQKRPLVGICFGHQAIAQALGGKVEKFHGGWAVGRQTYDGVLGPVAINAWHQDQVTRAPEGAKTIMQNDFCQYAGLAIGDHILSIQPHPEFSAPFIKALADTRGRGVVPDELLDEVDQKLDQPLDTKKVADQIISFFKNEGKNV